MSSTTLDRRQGLSGNLAIKAPVDCATTGNITLSGEQTIDGVTTSESRVLVWSQTNAVENGIYDSSSASWTRAIDFSGVYDAAVGTLVEVAAGSTLGGQFYIVSGTAPIAIGSSSISFSAAPLAVGSLAAQLADTASAGNGDALIGVKSALTGAVATTQHAVNSRTVWAADFGHSPSASAATNDAALIAAMTAVYNAGGGTVRLAAGDFSHITVPFTWSAFTTVNLVGEGMVATILRKSGATTTPVLNFTGSNGSNPRHIFSTFSDLHVIGTSTCPGLKMTLIAGFFLRNVWFQSCDVAFENVGSLIGSVEDCYFDNSVIGYRSRKSGAVCCNLMLFRGGSFRSNSSFAADIGDTSGLKFDGTDFEANGTTGNAATGGIIVRDTCDDEIGYAVIALDNVWMEANLGTTLKVEAGGGIILSLRNTQLILVESGRAITAGAIRSVTIQDCSIGGTATVTLAAEASLIENSVITTLADTSTRREYVNVVTGGNVIQRGSNACGTATLVGGAKTVSYGPLRGTELILLTSLVDGGTVGFLRVTSRTAGSFNVGSSSGTDTSTFAWCVIEAV